MDISNFSKKPELIKVVIDDESIVESYGEPIIFFMKEFVDIVTYFDFFKSQSDNGEELNNLLAKIILKEDGSYAIGEGEALPVDISVAALTKINETLGKSRTKSSVSKTGNQQK